MHEVLRFLLLRSCSAMNKRETDAGLQIGQESSSFLLRSQGMGVNWARLSAESHYQVAVEIERGLIQGDFDEEDAGLESSAAAADPWRDVEQLPTLQQTEERLVAEALRRADGNQGAAAGLLGISRQALNKRLSRQRQAADGDEA